MQLKILNLVIFYHSENFRLNNARKNMSLETFLEKNFSQEFKMQSYFKFFNLAEIALNFQGLQ